MKESSISIPGSREIVKRVAIYCRVSTADQRDHGVSIDDQIDCLTSWVRENRYILAGIYNDAGISARARYRKRPDMLRMLDDCKSGKIDLIVMTKLDRFFRNIRDFYEVLTMLDEYGVAWKTIREDYETETAAGRLKLNIMMAVAQDEADRTSERIKATFSYKAAKGESLGGKAPWGYRWQSGQLVIDENEESFVRLMFDTYLSSFDYQRTLRALREAGCSTITYQHMREISVSETYCGRYRCGTCPPYITCAQHELILKRRQQRSRKPVNNHVYIFAGLCKCGRCGMNMVGTADVYGKSRYRCSSVSRGCACGMRSLSENAIEAALVDAIDDSMKRASRSEVQKKPAQMSTKGLQNKLERLKDLYIEGDISKERYQAQKAAVQAKIDSIVELNNKPVKLAPTLPEDWKDEYNALSAGRKKAFWAAITDSVTIGDTITVSWY